MQNLKENIIVNKTFDFALHIISYTEDLVNIKKFVISKQLLFSNFQIHS
jgi:hypothetical protein